jgi:hypothetical protein
MRIIETKVYTIEEHPSKEVCFDYLRNNFHDLNQHSVDEIIASLKALQDVIGGELDYSICQVPARGEFISFTNYDKDALCRLSSDDCPLTGFCWDIDVIVGLRTSRSNKVLESLHEDTGHLYSDEGLKELCIANNYEFTDRGELI